MTAYNNLKKNRPLTSQQQLAGGKFWSIISKYIQKQKLSRLINDSRNIIYQGDKTHVDINKKDNKALKHQQKRDLGIVQQADLEV